MGLFYGKQVYSFRLILHRFYWAFYLFQGRLLNLQGEAKYNSSIELIQLLKNLDASIKIFEHTSEEIHSVIKSCSDHIEDPNARGQIVFEMRKQRKTKSDMLILLGQLIDKIEGFGIIRTKTPPYNPKYQIDESILQDALDEEIDYYNPRALEYDVNSIRSIYALRGGRAPNRLENAFAVLVTSNAKLAKVAYLFGKRHQESREVSSVITGFSLANVAWLKSPLQAPGLPERELIATCYAALEPGVDLWARYLAELEKLRTSGNISADDHVLLRSSYVAREELMSMTQGGEDDLTGYTVTDIHERVKRSLVEEERKKLESERKSHEDTKKELEHFIDEKEYIRRRVEKSASLIAKIIMIFLLIIVIAGIVAASIFSPFLTSSYIKNSRNLTAICNGLILLGGIIGCLTTYYGFAIRSVAKEIEEWITRLLYTHFYSWIVGKSKIQE